MKTDIYFNGRFIGDTSKPEEYAKGIRHKRRMGVIPQEVNIVYYKEFNEIRILTEGGRVRRPLIIVENGKPKLTDALQAKIEAGSVDVSYLLNHGIIEFLDAEEEENTYIALSHEELTKDHTHMEIDPVAMLGTSAALIPYPEFNRGDRINYGAKMIGQAVGLPVHNFLMRMETKFNVLTYPQSPLVTTKTSNKIISSFPEGQNIVLAVMCYDGYNMQDAVVVNKSSVDRGLFRSFYYRTYESLKKRYWGGQEDLIQIPEPGIRGHRGEDAYKELASDGVINPETKVGSDSVLVGKISPLRFLTSEEFATDIENKRETSTVLRHGEKGTVDKVFITETVNGEQLIKLLIRDERVPTVGDKFASRHGQKGVVGIVVPEMDMPFTSAGITPDILFNPHGIPSRMTVGQMLEVLGGKAGALTGQKVDGSAFDHVTDEEIRKMLKSAGFRENGKEVLYDGRTGKAYEVMIYVGVSYYLKLDHMVTDKIHARSRGPVTLLTKQPTEGRAKRGGLRVGEMEQQCLIGHGGALTLKERFDSDKTFIPICKKCGLIATHDVIKNKTFCNTCRDSEIVWVETAYAFKLTLDEFKATGIHPKLVTKEI